MKAFIYSETHRCLQNIWSTFSKEKLLKVNMTRLKAWWIVNYEWLNCDGWFVNGEWLNRDGWFVHDWIMQYWIYQLIDVMIDGWIFQLFQPPTIHKNTISQRICWGFKIHEFHWKSFFFFWAMDVKLTLHCNWNESLDRFIMMMMTTMMNALTNVNKKDELTE